MAVCLWRLGFLLCLAVQVKPKTTFFTPEGRVFTDTSSPWRVDILRGSVAAEALVRARLSAAQNPPERPA